METLQKFFSNFCLFIYYVKNKIDNAWKPFNSSWKCLGMPVPFQCGKRTEGDLNTILKKIKSRESFCAPWKSLCLKLKQFKPCSVCNGTYCKAQKLRKSRIFVIPRNLLFTHCNGCDVCRLVVYNNQSDTLECAVFFAAIIQDNCRLFQQRAAYFKKFFNKKWFMIYFIF